MLREITMPPPSAPPRALSTDDLPQADRIDRVIELVQAGDGATLEGRDLAYYRHAARVLGWLDEDHQRTRGGLRLAEGPEAARMNLAARAFASSRVGDAWLTWSHAATLAQLEEDSAEAFLAECSDAAPSTAARRAGTLKSWLRALRAFDSTPVQSDSGLRAFLLRPVADARLPTRMLNWSVRQGLRSFAELVARDPEDLAEEKNLGRKSLADTQEFFRAATGLGWAELRKRLPSLVPSSSASTTEATLEPELAAAPPQRAREELTWDELASAMPKFAQELPLTRLDLPTRMRNFCEREQLHTLGELMAQPSARLRQTPNLGRTSLEDTRFLIVQLLRQTESQGDAALAPSVRDFPDFFSLWRQRLASLSANERLVITQRIGMLGEAATLETIGELLGVTRERVRQLESNAIAKLSRDAWWIEGIDAQLENSLIDGVVGLAELAQVPWFRGVDTREAEFRYFLERFAQQSWSLVSLLGRSWLSQAPKPAFEAQQAALGRALKSLPFPVPAAEVQALIHAHAIGLPPRFASLLEEFFEAELHRSESDDRPSYTGFGDTRRASVLAFVRASQEPVSVQAIEARFGRGNLPEELVYVQRGAVMAPANIPGFGTWQERLAPACAALMQKHGPERQWSTQELMELLAPVARLPEWLNDWHLASMLRLDAKHVVYLGRQRVCLPETQRDSRVYVHDVARDVLLAAGEPLPDEVLRSRTSARVAVSDLAWSAVCSGERGGIVRVGPNQVGLIDRDVPGGEGAFAEAADLLRDGLLRRMRGFSAPEALAELREADAVYADWTREMVHAVGRSHATLRTAVNGSIGLSEWDDVRVPGQREIVREALERGGGRASLSEVLERIEQLHDSRPTRATMVNVAIAAGAQLRGDYLLDASAIGDSAPPAASETAARPELPGLPSFTVDLFAHFFDEAPHEVNALRTACLKHAEDFRIASHSNEFVNASEAERLAKLCVQLLDSHGQAPSQVARRLVWAAARYFVTVEDADSDFSIGGLDDDIAVANAVATYLGHAAWCIPIDS